MPNYLHWLRSRIGHRKVILAYATALIRDDDGRLLFQRRTDFSDEWWGLPGGLLEIGETFEDCVMRETFEETGWQVKPTRLIGLYTSPDYDVRYPNGDEAQQFTAAFECNIIGGQLRTDDDEVCEHRFFALNDLPRMPRWYEAMARDWDLRSQRPQAFVLRGEHPRLRSPAASPLALPTRDAAASNSSGPTFDPPHEAAANLDGWRSLRQLIGPDRLIIAGAAALIQNEAGQILLGLRREGLWGLPAGLMELGESISGTLVREAREEMNVEIAPRELIGVFTGPRFFHTYADGNHVQIVSAFFRADIVGGELKADDVETLDLRWFDLAALPANNMPARHRWLLEYALAQPRQRIGG